MTLSQEMLSKLSKDPDCKRLLEKLKAAGRALERLEDEFKLARFRPNPGGQEQFFENADKPRRAYFAGNRGGKSTTCSAEDISWAIGERIWYEKGDPRRRLGIPTYGVKGLVIGQTWDKVQEIFTGGGEGGAQKGKIKHWCPGRYITGETKDQLGRTTKLFFRNVVDGKQRDSVLYFTTRASFERNEMNLESSDWDFIHVDEPIPEAMWTAVSRGLIDRGGFAWFGLTPLSEMWIWELFKDKSEQHPDKYWYYQGSTLENPHLSATDMFFENLSEEELACRRDGKPLALGRLVIHGYSPDHHLLKGTPKGWRDEDTPPKDALVCVAVDTHPQTAHAVLVCAVTPTDAIFFDERFEGGSVKGICDWLKSKPWFNQIGFVVIEPAAFIVDQNSGTCYADTFYAEGISVEKGSKQRTEAIKLTNEAFLSSLPPRPSSFIAPGTPTSLPTDGPPQAGPGLQAVQTLLSPRTSVRRWPHVWIHQRLRVTRREIGNWAFTKDNKPKDADDHMMECMGRIIMKNNLRYFPPPTQANDEAEAAVQRMLKRFGGNSFSTNFEI